MKTFNKNMFTSGNLAGSINSTPVFVGRTVGFFIQAVFTGSPVGSFKLQLSGDDSADGTVTNWTDLSGSSASISAAGNYAWTCDGIHARWVRLVWTVTSGTGTVNAECVVKEDVPHGL